MIYCKYLPCGNYQWSNSCKHLWIWQQTLVGFSANAWQFFSIEKQKAGRKAVIGFFFKLNAILKFSWHIQWVFQAAKSESLGIFISQTCVKLTHKHEYVQVQHAEHRWHSKLLVNTRHHPRSTISYKVWDLKRAVSCVCAIVQYCNSLILQYVLLTLLHEQRKNKGTLKQVWQSRYSENYLLLLLSLAETVNLIIAAVFQCMLHSYIEISSIV